MEKKVYIVITEDDEPFIQGVFSEQIHAQAYADKYNSLLKSEHYESICNNIGRI